MTQASGDGKTVYFDYDDGNNMIGRTIPNGSRDSYIYNEANKIVGSQSAVTGNNHKWLNNYEYNQDGRLIKITDGSGSTTADYVYNNGVEKLNRLTQASITAAGSTYTFDYQYDAAGNMLSMEIPNGSGTQTLGFTYDADNRITNSGFAYDANGNLTQATMHGKVYNYGYDSANRLIQVTDTSTNPDKVINYSYDGDGLRLSKTVNDGVTIVTTNYHYFQGQLMYETVGDTITALYIRSATGTLQAVKWNGSYYYYHYNAHGDVTGVTNSTGSVYRQYFYDPYGNLIQVQDGSGAAVDIDTDSFNHAYTYAGYRYDKETGLYFLNARYYAPGIGRFLTKDTVVGVSTDPLSLNRYAYTEGDPVNFSDPTGHDVGWAHSGNRQPYGFDHYTFSEILTIALVALGPAVGVVKGAAAAGKAVKGAGNRTFKELLSDIEKNPGNWKKASESIINSTKKGNKGGKSIEEVFVNKKTGEKIYRHTLKDATGKLIEAPHYRPYGKQ